MTFNSYSQLKQSVTLWLNDKALEVRVPDFIRLGESVINRRLNHRLTMGYKRYSTSSGEMCLPDDFKGVLALRVPGYEPMEYLSPYAFTQVPYSGYPLNYTIVGNQLLIAPFPTEQVQPTAIPVTVTMLYRQRIAALQENSVNWLLDQYPDLYLYAALTQAIPFLTDGADRAQTWVDMFDAAVSSANLDGQIQSQGATLQMNVQNVV